MALDYYHQKVNARVVSQVNKQLNTSDLRKLVYFKKSPKGLDMMESSQPGTQNSNFYICDIKSQKFVVKNSIKKLFLSFVNLSKICCTRCYQDTHFDF